MNEIVDKSIYDSMQVKVYKKRQSNKRIQKSKIAVVSLFHMV